MAKYHTSILASLLAIILATATSYTALASSLQSQQAVKLGRQLRQLTQNDNLPGAVVAVREPNGHTRSISAGTRNIETGQRMVGGDGYFRVGSITKSVIAVTLVQLASQHKLDLNRSIDDYLPGVVKGTDEGGSIDGRNISVRQLLQHTSGLPEFGDDVDLVNGGFTPEDVLRIALAKQPVSQPGQLMYSNTNYVVAGMLIEKLTGQNFREATQKRVLKPLGMHDTYWPDPTERDIRTPRAHNYASEPGGQLTDRTLLAGYDIGASGGLISTPHDVNKFWWGLYRAKLFSPYWINVLTDGALQMPEQPGLPPHSRYGLGVVKGDLSCGGSVWLHGGDLANAVTAMSGRNSANKSATVYVTGGLQSEQQGEQLLKVLDTALCD